MTISKATVGVMSTAPGLWVRNMHLAAWSDGCRLQHGGDGRCEDRSLGAAVEEGGEANASNIRKNVPFGGIHLPGLLMFIMILDVNEIL